MNMPPVKEKSKALWEVELEASRGEVDAKSTPKGLLKGLQSRHRKAPPTRELNRLEARPAIDKIEMTCPTCAGIGNVPLTSKVKAKKQKFRAKAGREERKNADIIRAICGWQETKLVREVTVRTKAWNHKIGMFVWLDLICHGLDPRELSYSRFPSKEQLDQKLHWKRVLKELAKSGDPKAKEKASLIWKVQPCNKDGSWKGKGVGCEVLHKPTGLAASAITKNFWRSRSMAERQLAIKLGIFEPYKLYYHESPLANEPAHKRIYLALKPPWKEDPESSRDWPFDWWPVRPTRTPLGEDIDEDSDT